MPSSCRKHRQSCKIFSESRAFWKHFVTSQTQAAAPHLQFEKMVMPKATRPRNGAVRPGIPSDLGGRRDLEARVRLSCPLSAMGRRPGRGAASRSPRSPWAPTCHAGHPRPRLRPHPHPHLQSCSPVLPPPDSTPRRNAATEPAGGNLPASASAHARPQPRPAGAVPVHRPAEPSLRPARNHDWSGRRRATGRGRGPGRL